MNDFLSSARTPALLWLGLALAASLAPLTSLGYLLLALGGALCALALPQPREVRVASALAMTPIAIADAPTWAFVVAGGLLAATIARPAVGSAPSGLERIQRHLEWCRRRGESAHLVWVHAPHVDRDTATAALQAFRVTDAASLLHEGDGGEEIVAMVDDTSFERSGLERRLRAYVGDAAGFGWATFPDDGLTLDVLFAAARAAAVASTSEPARIETQLSAQFRRLGGRPPAGVPARSSNQG